MLRSLTVLVVGAVLTWSLPVALSPIAIAPAAPVPTHLMKSAPERYYFPIRVGTTCVYDSDGDEERVTVSKVEAQGAAFVVTATRTHNGSPSGVEVRRVTSAGVLRISSDGMRFPDPVPEVLTPFKVGDTWGELRQPGAFRWIVRGVETVTVPAGSFESVRVDEQYFDRCGLVTTTSWYAPGIGLVKWSFPPLGCVKVLTSVIPGQD